METTLWRQSSPCALRQDSHRNASSSGRHLHSAYHTAWTAQISRHAFRPAKEKLICKAYGERDKEPVEIVPVPLNKQEPAFGSLERQITDNLTTKQPGLRDDWSEVEGCWVLGPPAAERPKAVVQFVGGAFVGAAPQLSYRLLLEALAAKGLLVITAPYPTGFNHLKIADEVHFKLDRATRALGVTDLRAYGLGHSLGSLIHMLIGSQYPAQRTGNILMSFNNKDVLESIPFFAPFIAPGARALAPILSQLAKSPLGSQIAQPLELLRGLNPDLTKQFLPLLDQLLPLYMDVADGRQEFTPSPNETKRLIRARYGIPRNLLVQFENDVIDETAVLSDCLSSGSAVASSELDLTVRILPGDHIEPLQQKLGNLPPQVAEAVSQGNEFLDQLGKFAADSGSPFGAQFQDFAKGISGLTKDVADGNSSAAQVMKIERIAEVISEWIDLQALPIARKELPAASRQA